VAAGALLTAVAIVRRPGHSRKLERKGLRGPAMAGQPRPHPEEKTRTNERGTTPTPTSTLTRNQPGPPGAQGGEAPWRGVRGSAPEQNNAGARE